MTNQERKLISAESVTYFKFAEGRKSGLRAEKFSYDGSGSGAGEQL